MDLLVAGLLYLAVLRVHPRCHYGTISFLLFTLVLSHCVCVSCFLFTSVHLRWFPFCGCFEHSCRNTCVSPTFPQFLNTPSSGSTGPQGEF